MATEATPKPVVKSGPKIADRELIDFEWRTGASKTKQAKFVYAQLDEKPSKDDILIGEMKTPAIAKQVVEAHNGQFD